MCIGPRQLVKHMNDHAARTFGRKYKPTARQIERDHELRDAGVIEPDEPTAVSAWEANQLKDQRQAEFMPEERECIRERLGLLTTGIGGNDHE